MEKRVTKKDYFEILKGVVAGHDMEVELVEFLDKQIALATKKSGTKTKTQKENEELVEVIYEALAKVEGKVTVTELQASDETVGTLSNQKVSALLKMLVEAGRVEKTQEKKKSYFSVIAE